MTRAVVVVVALCVFPGCRLLGLFPEPPCVPGRGAEQCPSGVCGVDGECLSPDAVATQCSGPAVLARAFDDEESMAAVFALGEGAAFVDGDLVVPTDDATGDYGAATSWTPIDLRAAPLVLDLAALPTDGDVQVRLQPPYAQGGDAIVLRGANDELGVRVEVAGDDAAQASASPLGTRWRVRVADDALLVEQGTADDLRVVLDAPAPPFVDAVHLSLASYSLGEPTVFDAVNAESPREMPHCPSTALALSDFVFVPREECAYEEGSTVVVASTTTEWQHCRASSRRAYDFHGGGVSIRFDRVELGAQGHVALSLNAYDAGDEVQIEVTADDDEITCAAYRAGDEVFALSAPAADATGLGLRVVDGRVLCDAATGAGEIEPVHETTLPFPVDAAVVEIGVWGPGPLRAEFRDLAAGAG